MNGRFLISCVTGLLALGMIVAGCTVAAIHSDQMQRDQKVACAEAGGGFSGGGESDTICIPGGGR